ncbi:MAG: Tad domain-containing protein [Endomicrobium sp.]|jgi:hypothetical protein|nr:Tad domain-containing protein [Endomicrobium sp.]
MNNKGQTLYYFLILIMILLMSWAMMLNIGKLIIDRMKMQNTADNIALSLAAQKARTYNAIGGMNYLIGIVLSAAMNPTVIQFPSYSTELIGGLPATMQKVENPLSDIEHSSGKTKKDGVKTIKTTVEALQTAQKAAMLAYIEQIYETLYKNNTGDYNTLVLSMPDAKDLSKPEKYLNLKKNSKGITYLKTVNDICVQQKVHFHFLSSPKFESSEYSWLVEDEDFNEQKIAVMMRKKSTNKKPIFARLLGIEFPSAIVYSAAAPYNVKGSMFPKEERVYTGYDKTIDLFVEASSLLQAILMERAILETKSIPYVGWVIAALGSGFLIEEEARNRIRIAGIKTKDNPIDAYLDAKAGGWAAHLIPYRSPQEDD